MNLILEVLDWLVSIAERLMVLGLVCVVFYLGYRFLWGSPTPDQLKTVAFLAQNWKAVIIVMIPLFYGTVKRFLEEVQEFAGMKRKRPGTPAGEESVQ